jgi:very-short-patch-repair endonuclease
MKGKPVSPGNCDHYFPVMRSGNKWTFGPCEFCGIKKPKAKLKTKKKEDPNAAIFVKMVKTQFGLDIVPEYRFHGQRQWRIDYAIPGHRVAIEVEGGRFKKREYTDKQTGEKITTIGGRHNSGTGFRNDMDKYNQLSCLGWLLIRTTPEELITAKTLDNIKECVKMNEHWSKMAPF